MKKIFCIAIFITAVYFGKSQSKNFIDQPYIEVKGQADTSVTPNEIFIKIILSEKDTKDRVSIEELETRMVDSLKSLGINTEMDLTTTDIASNFRFYFLKKKDVMKTKEYILKVTNAVTATNVFITLENLEISNSSIERVGHTDLELLSNKTRSNAIRNAKKRAIFLTEPLNQSVGNAIFIADSESPDFIANRLNGSVAGINLKVRGNSSFALGRENLQKVDFEKIKITSEVIVRFILK